MNPNPMMIDAEKVVVTNKCKAPKTAEKLDELFQLDKPMKLAETLEWIIEDVINYANDNDNALELSKKYALLRKLKDVFIARQTEDYNQLVKDICEINDGELPF